MTPTFQAREEATATALPRRNPADIPRNRATIQVLRAHVEQKRKNP
jgi:hypothetical protein